MTPLQRALTAADGYLDLGMAQEADDELDGLPPELQAAEATRKMRSEITCLRCWPRWTGAKHVPPPLKL